MVCMVAGMIATGSVPSMLASPNLKNSDPVLEVAAMSWIDVAEDIVDEVVKRGDLRELGRD